MSDSEQVPSNGQEPQRSSDPIQFRNLLFAVELARARLDAIARHINSTPRHDDHDLLLEAADRVRSALDVVSRTFDSDDTSHERNQVTPERLQAIQDSLIALRVVPFAYGSLQRAALRLDHALSHSLDQLGAGAHPDLTLAKWRPMITSIAEHEMSEVDHRSKNRAAERNLLAWSGGALLLLVTCSIVVKWRRGNLHGSNLHQGLFIAYVGVLLSIGIALVLAAAYPPESQRRIGERPFTKLRRLLPYLVWVPALIVSGICIVQDSTPHQINLEAISFLAAAVCPVIVIVSIALSRMWGSGIVEDDPTAPTMTESGTETVSKFLIRLQATVAERLSAAKLSARRWRTVNIAVGSASALLAGAAGVSGLSDLRGAPRAIIGVMGLVGAGLAGTATSLGAAGNSEAAERKSIDYEALILDIENLRAKAHSAEELKNYVDQFVARAQRINASSSSGSSGSS